MEIAGHKHIIQSLALDWMYNSHKNNLAKKYFNNEK